MGGELSWAMGFVMVCYVVCGAALIELFTVNDPNWNVPALGAVVVTGPVLIGVALVRIAKKGR